VPPDQIGTSLSKPHVLPNGAATFRELYGPEDAEIVAAGARYRTLREILQQKWGEGEPVFFSSPGRTELGGNHTDHHLGRVLAASVHLDTIAATHAADDGRIVIRSEGYAEPIAIELCDLAPRVPEQGTSTALLRGVASAFRERGLALGAFRAAVATNVLVGSGLSSSASFEVLLGTILNVLFNNGSIPPATIARIGQQAENGHFGKPCGLMDQLACATGGALLMDFSTPDAPAVTPVPFAPEKDGYALLVVDSGGKHTDLTGEYAAIPREMRSVARVFGKEFCRDVPAATLLAALPFARQRTGDRAVLRALHFAREQERVLRQADALGRHDMKGFLEGVRASGASSFRLLQNCIPPGDGTHQALPLALALADDFVSAAGDGACRVHGGGFAGTIQVYVRDNAVREFTSMMEQIFGPSSVTPLRIRSRGATVVAVPASS
jgi:galactokinase